MNAESRKNLGAYYTDQKVANFLASWAIRNPKDRVLDPSYGDGVFLLAASQHLRNKGIKKNPAIYGIDIQSQLRQSISAPTTNLIQSDFFKVEPSDLEKMDVIVGNPPFIRYQRFNGETRKSALKICKQVGAELPELSSSWAPFLIHATRFLRPGGRLAMVVPAEINHASYAIPVIKYFLNKFRSIKIIAFRKRIFPELSQDTYCLLADNYGEQCENLSLVLADSANSLENLNLESGKLLGIESIRSGKTRLIENLISDESRSIYHSLVNGELSKRLGEISKIGIGYVTGANEYFHLTESEVKKYKVPSELLKPAIRSGKQLKGIRFAFSDWEQSRLEGEKSWLLAIPSKHKNLPDSLVEYLNFGVKSGINNAYKCKVREVWYSVPHVYVGDAFLSYMSGNIPRLVANTAGVVASNSLHLVNILNKKIISPEHLSYFWNTSLTMMSSEIEGHALGGGMLKLEPSEAERISIPFPKQFIGDDELFHLDNLLRLGEFESALDYADKTILVDKLGLTKQDCIALKDGLNQLRSWRMR